MGRIQSNIGLITGINIGDTVKQLMQIAARPRDLLATRTEALKKEQMAVSELSALLLALQYTATNLAKDGLYNQRVATSSDPSALAATVTGDAAQGVYQLIPLRTVQYHQFLSSGVKSDTAPLGAGSLTFRFGPHLAPSLGLDLLGGGGGASRGVIRITDRSGASAEIDLSTARSVDDVLEAINSSTAIDVTATAHGDRIKLVDNTGQTLSNLKVQEVGGGSTAASLGLAGIDVAADTAEGQDVLWLTADLELDWLNDGGGVNCDRVFGDIAYQLRDGTTGTIDLSPILPGSSTVDAETTLGEILDRINAAQPGKLQVEIAPDGDRLLLSDLTEGEGEFSVQPLHDSTALRDLGLDGDPAGGVITGRRLLGGLKTVLLSTLEGGQGLGQLGQLALTDRSGASDTVDLATAETLDDVLQILNAASVGITARLNGARNGIELVDTTGASSSPLIVANADATETADKLHIAVEADVTSVNSGDLHRKIISHNTALASLNGGAGVARGKITLYDTTGQHAQLELASERIQTVGDVLRAINRLGLAIQAELNPTGDGIRLRDLARGTQTMRVVEGSATTAADLHLLGSAVEVDIEGEMTQVIDGATTYTAVLDEDDSLADLRDKINQLGAGVTASILSDGSSKPFRLAIHSDRPGTPGQLVVDTSNLSLSLQEAARAQDALLALGDASTLSTSVLLSSPTGTLEGVIPGVRLQVRQSSATPVTVTVEGTDTNFVAGVTALVDSYNRFRAKLDELTAYEPTSDTRSILTGDATALRLDADLSYLLSGSFAGASAIRSLGELGIALQDDGTLELDRARLKAKFAEDPEGVKRFFAEEQFGLAARLDQLLDRLAGEDDSLLASRIQTLSDKIDDNQQRIKLMNARLQRQQDRLYLDFYRLELAIGKLRNSLSVVEAIQPLAPLSLRSD